MVVGTKTTVILQRNSGASDGIWGNSDTWGDLKRVVGVLIPVSGSRGDYYDRLGVQASHIFRMDYPNGYTVTTADRIRHGTTYYMIKWVQDLNNRHHELELALEEGVGKNR